MLKKTIAAALAAALMVFCFAGCGNKTEPEAPDDAAEETESAAETIPEKTFEHIESLGDTILVDSKDIKIGAKTLLSGGEQTSEVELNISNGTDKDLYFQTRNESINGCMVNGILSELVEANTEKTVQLQFMSAALEQYGIVAIEQLDFNFYIFTKDDYEEYLTSDPITIKMEIEGEPVKFTEAESVLYDQAGIRISEMTNEKYAEDAFDYTSVIRIVNDTESDIILMSHSMSEESVDLFAQVPAGKTSIVNATLHSMPDYEEPETEESAKDGILEKQVEVSLTISGAEAPIEIENVQLTLRCRK